MPVYPGASAISKRHQVEASRDEIFAAFGSKGILFHFDIPHREECQAELVEAATRRLQQVDLYPGAKEALIQLRLFVRLAIVSDCSRHIIEDGLVRHQLQSHFDTVVARADAGSLKPDPAGIEMALARMDAAKNRSIMVGDSAKDIQAAQNAGVDVALFFPETHRPLYDPAALQRHGPTYTLGSFSELNDVIVNSEPARAVNRWN